MNWLEEASVKRDRWFLQFYLAKLENRTLLLGYVKKSI